MTARKNRLRAVPSLVGKTGFQYRFDVASQVMAAGAQDIHVQVILPLSGPGQGQIGVRVGRLLVYVANREALGSFPDAWGKAAGLAEKVFGPDLPLPRWVNPSQPTSREGLRHSVGASSIRTFRTFPANLAECQRIGKGKENFRNT